LVLAVAWFLTHEAGEPPTAPSEFPLVATPDAIDLGVLRPGSAKSASVRIRNAGPVPVEVQTVQTSCSCLHGRIAPTRIEPGETGLLTIDLDLSHDTDATGQFGMEVWGQGLAGEHLFRVMVKFTASE
jgi:hypothetical protein